MIATDINDKLLAGLKEAGVAECIKLDVRDTRAIEAEAKRLGAVDVLFNGAGFVHHGTVLDCTDEEWDFAFDLNVSRCIARSRHFCRACSPRVGRDLNIAPRSRQKPAVNRYVYTRDQSRRCSA